jgi:hypothetical protein
LLLVGSLAFPVKCHRALPSGTHHAGRQENRASRQNVHEVSLEEGLQLPLGCRVGEVSDVESSSLRSAGQDRIVLGGLVGGGGLVGDGCVAKSGSNVVDGVRKLFHDSRHDGEECGCGCG